MDIKQADVERLAWEILGEQATSPKAEADNGYFTAFGATDDSLMSLTAQRMIDRGLVQNVENRWLTKRREFACALLEVYYSARHTGLIIPGRWDQGITWNGENGAYQFSSRGLAFFRNGEISLSAPGILAERVRTVVASGSLDPGIVPLIEEAQRCWGMGCLRAAMVLIGLASEEVCTGLLDELCNHPSPPVSGAQLSSDWKKLNDDAASFYTRWQSGLRLLDAIKQNLSRQHRSVKPDWWKTWEPLPGSVQPYAEAVRIARNTAAHSVDDIFTPAQVGLLLASLPTMIEVVSNLTAFLKTPPAGISLPAL